MSVTVELVFIVCLKSIGKNYRSYLQFSFKRVGSKEIDMDEKFSIPLIGGAHIGALSLVVIFFKYDLVITIAFCNGEGAGLLLAHGFF
jgi:hypothetical protein